MTTAPVQSLTLIAYAMTNSKGWEGRVTTLAEAEHHREAYGFEITEVKHTYSVGDSVQVWSYSGWRAGTVTGLGRTRVTVKYASDAAGRNVRTKSFGSGEIRPGSAA